MNRKKHQILKILLLCLISSKSSASEKELNLQFIRHKFGQNTEDIELFFNSSTVLPGNYTVDVKLNDEVIGRAKLEVSQDDKESYCLKDEWLSD
ncbi:usher protein, partial [Escherichia coli]|nr:usher protein [Escherichia coli]